MNLKMRLVIEFDKGTDTPLGLPPKVRIHLQIDTKVDSNHYDSDYVSVDGRYTLVVEDTESSAEVLKLDTTMKSRLQSTSTDSLSILHDLIGGLIWGALGRPQAHKNVDAWRTIGKITVEHIEGHLPLSKCSVELKGGSFSIEPSERPLVDRSKKPD